MFNIEFNYDTEMSIINEIKNNSIENFRDLIDYYFDKYKKSQDEWRDIKSNYEGNVKNNTEEIKTIKEDIVNLQNKLKTIFEKSYAFDRYITSK